MHTIFGGGAGQVIGIVDADLIGRDKHRFPNLVCEKISAYWKEKGESVTLLSDYEWSPENFGAVYVSKVFTDTPVPDWIRETDKIHIGGTGFYFDKAPNLPTEIEHHMPDYGLYDDWIETAIAEARTKKISRAKGLMRQRSARSSANTKNIVLDFSPGAVSGNAAFV